jgi:serine/threonine protein phosphatase 1
MTFWKHLTGLRFLPVAAIPDNRRIYAIGDIHGRADLLNKMHQAILKHSTAAPPAQNCIVYLGDYTDRGLQVKEVMEILSVGSMPGFTSVFLKGNHEEMLLEFLSNAAALETWLQLGGLATLLSYGVIASGHMLAPDRAEEIRRAFIDALPETHHNFLLQLKTSYQAGDYMFVHAGLRPGIPLDKQNPQDCIWIREPFLSNRKHLGLKVVHGHHITEYPEMLAPRIGVDTGAYATGRLSCVILEADQAKFLTVQAGEDNDAPL